MESYLRIELDGEALVAGRALIEMIDDRDGAPGHPYGVVFQAGGRRMNGRDRMGHLINGVTRWALAQRGPVEFMIELGAVREVYLAEPRQSGRRRTLAIRRAGAPAHEARDIDWLRIWDLVSARQRDFLVEARLAGADAA